MVVIPEPCFKNSEGAYPQLSTRVLIVAHLFNVGVNGNHNE